MDYEKKYKEAIERAKEIYQGSYKPDTAATIAETLQYVFPVLKESENEDERIRKELINTINLAYDCGIAITIECRDKYLAWLEKQGERKSSDKVEPKFKAGDWVVLYSSEIEANRKVVQISRVEICQLNMYWTTEGTWFGDGTDARLWTIQDAKDGDVLCDYHEAYDNPLIFILKKFEHVNFGLVRPSDYSSYCYLTAGDRQRFKEGTYHHEHSIKPATKEQRELLFQKMKEAGHEWDAEKKKMKR